MANDKQTSATGTQPGKYLDTAGAAAYLGVSRKALEQWRARQTGPDHFKLDGRRGLVRYRPADLDRWMESRLVSHAGEEGR